MWYDDIVKQSDNEKIEVMNLKEKELFSRKPGEICEICEIGGENETANGDKNGLRTAMRELLSLPVIDADLLDSVAALGIDPDAIDNNRALAAALLRKALSGDVSSFKEIRSLIGEEGDAKAKKSAEQRGDGALNEILAAIKSDLSEE